jgi:hypothetical protein
VEGFGFINVPASGSQPMVMTEGSGMASVHTCDTPHARVTPHCTHSAAKPASTLAHILVFVSLPPRCTCKPSRSPIGSSFGKDRGKPGNAYCFFSPRTGCFKGLAGALGTPHRTVGGTSSDYHALLPAATRSYRFQTTGYASMQASFFDRESTPIPSGHEGISFLLKYHRLPKSQSHPSAPQTSFYQS